MKRVLKDLNTGLFFKNMDQWTASIDEAANFRDTLSALKFCEKNNLTGIAVILTSSPGVPSRVLGFRRNNPPGSIPSTTLKTPLALSDNPAPEE